MSKQVRKKDMKWLEQIGRRTRDPLGMYPGDRKRDIPVGPAFRLKDMGLLESYYPHNGAHDDRWVTTEKGDALLAARTQSPDDGATA